MSKCRICGSKEVSQVYHGAIRLGSYGKLAQEEYSVKKCAKCTVAYLDPCPEQSDDYYEDGGYRNSYNDSTLISDYYNNHDVMMNDRIGRIQLEELRGRTIADVGAGGGSFLDCVAGIVDKTIAVEPTKAFHSTLQGRHEVHGYVKELAANNTEVDIVTSFDVIEHVIDPVGFAVELREILKSGGRLILTTPNHKEILFDIVGDEFSSFYYRTAHLYYFTSESIEYVLRQAGFTDINIMYQHRYDLSNVLLWARDRRPTGIGACEYFDEATNYMFKKSLESNGMASDLWVEARK